MDPLYLALMTGATVAVGFRVVLRAEDRLAWGLIAAGLASWLAGEVYWTVVLSGDADVPYPSPADALYLLFYPPVIAGVLLLGGRVRGQSVASPLVVTLIGLATLWSWLVFGAVFESAEGGAMAVAFTVATPILDLFALAAVALAVATRGWRLDRQLALLAGGIGFLVVADSVYSVQVAFDTYVDGRSLDSLWPLAAWLIVAAAWVSRDRLPPPTARAELPLARISAPAAICFAIVVLVWDHFSRVNSVTTLLAGATMIAGVAQLLLLFREHGRERSRALTAEAIRSASAQAALDCVISSDRRGRVLEWNPAAELTFGYRRDEVVGRDLADRVLPPELRGPDRELLERLNAGDDELLDRRIETVGLDAAGRRFPIELAVTRVQDEPRVYTAFVRDISDRRARQEENDRLAAIVRSVSDAVISESLDGTVTSWNQGAERLYGYPAAEAIGRRLEVLIASSDRREELELARASAVAGDATAFETKRRHKDGELLDVAVQTYPIRGSDGEVVGISVIARDATERRREEQRQRVEREARLWRRRIREALDADGFVFWGQPVVDLATGEVDHHELLLRMSLDGDCVPPGRFLPYAESSELIHDIDRWAVERGIELAARSPVAINLSARSFEDPDLIGRIETALAGGGGARRVTFEITETAVAGNIDSARRFVAALTRLGCGVALDDFGTGYSSFTYLKHLGVSELKIDMEFVRDLLVDEADRRVVESIVSVAKKFAIRTVAEGVEDESTLEALRELGVDLVQGYHLGRPQPVDAVSALAPVARGLERAGAAR